MILNTIMESDKTEKTKETEIIPVNMQHIKKI